MSGAHTIEAAQAMLARLYAADFRVNHRKRVEGSHLTVGQFERVYYSPVSGCVRSHAAMQLEQHRVGVALAKPFDASTLLGSAAGR